MMSALVFLSCAIIGALGAAAFERAGERHEQRNRPETIAGRWVGAVCLTTCIMIARYL